MDTFRVGDFVVIRKVNPTIGVNWKLLLNYKGPYVIHKVLLAGMLLRISRIVKLNRYRMMELMSLATSSFRKKVRSMVLLRGTLPMFR